MTDVELLPLPQHIATVWGMLHDVNREFHAAKRYYTPIHMQAYARANLEAQAAEVERLTACLAKANSNHEEFERRWYLEKDRAERLEAEAVAAIAKIRAQYPLDLFSDEHHGARMARLTCDNILREFRERVAALGDTE